MNYFISISIFWLTLVAIQANAQHNNSEIPTSINDTGVAPDNSAILDINAADKGVLVPRMTQNARNAITNPTQGLLIFQIDNVPGFYYFDGTNWTPIAGTPTNPNTLDQAYDEGGAGAGRYIFTSAGPVDIRNSVVDGKALEVQTNTGNAINAYINYPSNTYSTIQSTTISNSTAASAVFGLTQGNAWGITGQASATSTAEAGIYGNNLRPNGGNGIFGVGFNGILGETNYNAGTAVFGQNYDNIGSFNNGAGVAGVGRFGVIGQDRYNGSVIGAYGVFSSGDLGASGTKTFMIDHPLDPENKILRHFSMESNEVLNIYRGNATFDSNGEAIIQLPAYFDAINQHPSYQLTPIGGAADLYIKNEIENNVFTIAGGRSGMKVSWTVHAERNDAYLQQFPEKRAVEVDKKGAQKGKYIMPNLYNSDNYFFYDTTTLKTDAPTLELHETPQ